ncbi:MAG: TolC family protein [Polyangiaceae bacterium]|nr:TolC family protein [Polyangiaceae bacterium]
MNLSRKAQYILPLAVALVTGCSSSTVATDVRDVNAFLAAQGRNIGQRPGAGSAISMPTEDAWENDGAEAPRILAKPLTADDAVKLALVQNRELRASMYELGIARGQAVQAGLLPNPEIEISLRAPQDPFQRLQADIGFEYDLSALILVPLRKGVADAELEATRVRVARDVLETAFQARLAFYDVQARQAVLDLQKRAFDAFQAGYAAAEELHRVGNLPDADLAIHRAAVEASRIDVAEAENALLDARERFNVAAGLSGQQVTWTIAGPLPPPEDMPVDAVVTEKKAITASLELAEIGRRMEAAAKRVGLHRTQGVMPHVSGGFHGEQDGISWELGGHVTVGLPIFDRAQGRIISAKSELGALRERYVAAAIGVRSSARMTQNRIESAGKRARHYQQALLPAREKALAETLLQYNAMHVSVFQVLDVQRRVTETGIAYTETLLDYWKARASLDQILAGGARPRALGAVSTGHTSSAGMDVGSGAGH